MTDSYLWLVLVLTLGGTARLTRLVTRDTITQPVRDAILYSKPQRAALGAGEPLPAPESARAARHRLEAHNLVSCDWCIGFWIAIAATLVAWQYHHTVPFLLVTAALTVSHAVGWLASHE